MTTTNPMTTTNQKTRAKQQTAAKKQTRAKKTPVKSSKKKAAAKLTPTTHREAILKHLQTLKIRLSEEQLDEVVRDATKNHHSLWEFLERLLAGPANSAIERSIENRIRAAKFRDAGTLESFDWSFNAKAIQRGPLEELATGQFIARGDNIAFVGKSGLGKSHLIQGIGRACCVLGHRVRYVTSAELLEELTAAAGDKTLPAKVRYYRAFDLLIIDEFGFDKLERREYPESPSLLYKVGCTQWSRFDGLRHECRFRRLDGLSR